MSRSLSGLALLLAVLPAVAQPVKAPPASLWQLRSALAQKPQGDDLKKLEAQVVTFFGKKDVESSGAKPKQDGTLVGFAIQVKPGNAEFPSLSFDEGPALAMMPVVPGSGVFVLFKDCQNFTQHQYQYVVKPVKQSGQDQTPDSLKGAGNFKVEHYPAHPDSFPKPDVPKGKFVEAKWDKSEVYPHTERTWAVYVPAQLKEGEPAPLMVFQDGGGYKYVTTIFDNLIARGELPPIVGVFVNPGDIPGPNGKNARPSHRSVEYDTLSDAYARFLRDEILPEAQKLAKVTFRKDAASRAICGRSSGGICAFTAAWEQPDQFGKVLSSIGSFTNIRGGDVYPGKVRKEAKRDVRVFLQDGSNDLDNEHGNWPLANRQMDAALKFRGYDYTAVYGEGFHSPKHEQAIMPDALRWLWRDYRMTSEKK